MKVHETVKKIRSILGIGEELVTKINITLEKEIEKEVVHDLIVDWCLIVNKKDDGTYDILNH